MRLNIPNVEYDHKYTFPLVSVGNNCDKNFSVKLEYDINFNHQPYFIYCNRYNNNYDEFIRISFNGLKYFIHSKDDIWYINKKDRKNLVEFFKSKPRNSIFKTNWELALFRWNDECRLAEEDYGWNLKYPTGCIPGSILETIPEFLPMNTKIPNYNKLNNIRRY